MKITTWRDGRVTINASPTEISALRKIVDAGLDIEGDDTSPFTMNERKSMKYWKGNPLKGTALSALVGLGRPSRKWGAPSKPQRSPRTAVSDPGSPKPRRKRKASQGPAP